MIHIHSPLPTNIRDGVEYENDPSIQRDRFGHLLFFTNGCCRKQRLAHNCQIQYYEWYDPLIVCKAGKECKRKEIKTHV